MTEIKREKVGGQTEVTSSSDEFIINNLKNIDLEYRGLANPPIIIDGESLTPNSNFVDDSDLQDVDAADHDEKVLDIAKLKHSDSALAKNLWEKRPQNKRKAA